MALAQEQAAFLLDACMLIQYATSQGWTVTGGELFRTIEQQKIYYDSGKSKTMASNHLRRLAIDLNFLKNGNLVLDKAQLQPIGTYWESLNPQNRWGGSWTSFQDLPHFERNV